MTKQQLQETLINHELWIHGNGGSKADLSGADLSGADLSRADLSRANLFGALYNLLDILRLNIANSSNDLALELMRWDATICGEELMEVWACNGNCPFMGKGNISRLFIFQERRSVWQSGKPTRSLLELWQWIAKENGIKI